MAILVAQLSDPVRIVAVIAVLWAISKLYRGESKIVPTVVGLIVVAVVLSVVLASMQAAALPAATWMMMTVTGFVANCIIWGICAGLLKAYRSQVAG